MCPESDYKCVAVSTWLLDSLAAGYTLQQFHSDRGHMKMPVASLMLDMTRMDQNGPS